MSSNCFPNFFTVNVTHNIVSNISVCPNFRFIDNRLYDSVNISSSHVINTNKIYTDSITINDDIQFTII